MQQGGLPTCRLQRSQQVSQQLPDVRVARPRLCRLLELRHHIACVPAALVRSLRVHAAQHLGDRMTNMSMGMSIL